jgi:hypothetical protein
MLALGHEIVRLVDEGLLKDLADAADLLGFTRARVTQIVDLTLLAPEIQEALLFGDGAQGRLSIGCGRWSRRGTGRSNGPDLTATVPRSGRLPQLAKKASLR